MQIFQVLTTAALCLHVAIVVYHYRCDLEIWVDHRLAIELFGVTALQFSSAVESL